VRNAEATLPRFRFLGSALRFEKAEYFHYNQSALVPLPFVSCPISFLAPGDVDGIIQGAEEERTEHKHGTQTANNEPPNQFIVHIAYLTF
jgi:hypothetical protein